MSTHEARTSVNSAQFRILDSMIDGVRLINKYMTVIHTNESIEKNIMSHTIGKKCYEGIGRCEKCMECGADITFETGETVKTYQQINGSHYMVISSPVYDRYNGISAVVEVFRNITKEKELEKSLLERNGKMKQDIDFAKKMQVNMLPLKGIYNDLKIDYYYEPSELLSGDMFDVFKINRVCTGFYICDVVGHGISASMISMYVRQTVRAISKDRTDINAIMGELHRTFLALNFDDDKYFSIFYCIFNKNTHTLEYINAGHNCLPLFKRGREITRVESKGYPICNIFDSVSYEINHLQMEENDKILFYTDGITEMKDEEGNFLQEEGLVEIFEKHDDIILNIEEEIKNIGGRNTDDLALLEIKVI